MKYRVNVFNLDTEEARVLVQESDSAMNAHKHVFMNMLDTNEEITDISNDKDKIVFDNRIGFSEI